MLNQEEVYYTLIRSNLSRVVIIIGLLSAYLLNTTASKAQIIQPNRLELPINEEEDTDYNIFSAGDKGLFITRQVKAVRDQMLWELLKVDSALNLEWRKEYLLSASYNFLDHNYFGDRLFMLFENFATGDRNLELVIFEHDGSALRSTIKNYIPFSFFDFKVTQNSLLVGGYFNYRPLVINYNFDDKIPRVLPGLFNDKARMVEMKVNKNGTFDVLLTGRTLDRKYTLFINTFDPNGNLIKNLALDTEKPRSLLFGRAETLDENVQIVAGVYGRRSNEYSRGIFVGGINAFGEQQLQYYNYAEFKNFFNYLRAGRERRVRNRIARRKIKNKRIRFNYRLLVHEIIQKEDQYIMLGEAFYPKYKTITGSQPGVFSPGAINRGLISTRVVFDGYRYTHSVAMAFDKAGNLLWDNSFEINDVISFELEQFVHATIREDNIALLYVFDNHIRSKVIKGADVIEGKELVDIKLQFKEDEITKKGTTIRGFNKWYDNVFYTFGTQRIRNRVVGGTEVTRNVFFINKVVYQ